MFKELFTENALNEGTAATITTLTKGLYKTSILQYDGYDRTMKPELKKHWDSAVKAQQLTTKTGELRGVHDGDAEYYTGRNLLMVTKDKYQALDNANETHYKYFHDGSDWYWAKGTIRDFKKMKKI